MVDDSKDKESHARDEPEGGATVGISKGKRVMIGLAALAIGSVLIYFSFNDKTKYADKKIKPTKEAIDKALKESISENSLKVDESINNNSISLPMKLPSLPEITVPEPPKPPAPPPSTVSADDFNPFDFGKKAQVKDDPSSMSTKASIPPPPSIPTPSALPMPPGAESYASPTSSVNSVSPKVRAERMAGSMFALSSKGGGSSSNTSASAKSGPILPSSPLLRSPATQSQSTYYGTREQLMAQGKVIEIVMETAIDTDLKGMLRGIVSQDVYSEAGTNVLIPKGSRALGTYSASLSSGQSRVAVVWNRIMRPDGVDVVLEMSGTDRLGRSGISGEVDYHMADQMRNALLVSLLTITSGVILNDIFGNTTSTQTTNTTTGAVSTSAPGAYTETQSALDSVMRTLQSGLDKTVATQQTIKIHAGTVMKAFVRQDIVFVGDSAYAYKAQE